MARRHIVPTKELLPSLRGLIKAFRAEIKPQRSLITFSFGAMLVSIGARLLEPWPLKFILDWVVVPAAGGQTRAAEKVPAWLSGDPSLTLVVLRNNFV